MLDDILYSQIDRQPASPSIDQESIIAGQINKPSDVLFDASVKTNPIEIESANLDNAVGGVLDTVAQSNSTVNNSNSQTSNSTVNNSYLYNSYFGDNIDMSSILNSEALQNQINANESNDLTNLSNLVSVKNATSLVNEGSISQILSEKNSSTILNELATIPTFESIITNEIGKNTTQLNEMIQNVTNQSQESSNFISETATKLNEMIQNVTNQSQESSNFISETATKLNELFNGEKTSENTRSIKTEDVFVKSNSLIDSSTARKLVTPSTVVEDRVIELSKTLPQSISQLSNTMTNIGARTNSSQITNNEGSKVVNNTTNVTNQGQPQVIPGQTPGETQKPIEIDTQNMEFYLQAIYQALLSGKVKVTLNY